MEFDQTVHVEGDPVLMLEVCDRNESVCEAEARYESGSGTDTLVFAYLVLEWDSDDNGIALPADPIDVSIDDFDGFSIRNDAGQEARLSYRREGTKSGHKVNGSRQAGQYLSVEDAEAHEADGEMTFTVRLEPRGLGIVTVNYATRDGSARAGSDYTETRGRLRFNPLERERTVTVPIIDDAHQDDRETFRLRLSNPDGALLGDREGHGHHPQQRPGGAVGELPGERVRLSVAQRRGRPPAGGGGVQPGGGGVRGGHAVGVGHRRRGGLGAAAHGGRPGTRVAVRPGARRQRRRDLLDGGGRSVRRGRHLHARRQHAGGGAGGVDHPGSRGRGANSRAPGQAYEPLRHGNP